MKTHSKLSLLSIFAVCLMSCSSSEPKDAKGLYTEIDQKSEPNTLTGKEKKSDWQILFDGSSTTGWRGYNMTIFPDAWAIEDGCLTMNTQGGAESQDIITEKTYKNFALSVDYKVTPGANSGVIYQIKEDTAYKFPYETGPEMQIIDDDGWPGGLEEWQKSGASYAMYPAKVKAYKPIGEWNHLFLYVKDNKVTQILNGEVVVEFEKYSDEWNKLRNSGKWTDYPDWGKFDEGHISLQNHGTKVWFRNVKIKEL